MTSRKAQANLERRIAAWNNLAAMGMSGTQTKLVRRHDGSGTVAYRKPGSQNRKKG